MQERTPIDKCSKTYSWSRFPWFSVVTTDSRFTFDSSNTISTGISRQTNTSLKTNFNYKLIQQVKVYFYPKASQELCDCKKLLNTYP